MPMIYLALNNNLPLTEYRFLRLHHIGVSDVSYLSDCSQKTSCWLNQDVWKEYLCAK